MIQKSYEFNISEKALVPIGRTIRYVQFFYHNSQNSDEYSERLLPTNEFPFFIQEINPPSNYELKEESFSWLSQKALEDFILGVNLGLMELNRFIELQNYSRKTQYAKVPPRKQIHDELEKIEKKIHSLNLPTMIKNIEVWLGLEMPLKKELLSINKARACYAHRNGIVSNLKDINDLENNCLTITWKQYETEIKLESGEWKKMTYELRKNGVTALGMRIAESVKSLSFEHKEKIMLELEELNGIGLTCIKLIQILDAEFRKRL